jgi:2-desacetyl-2-hydroxyethyl bacteriochlorophyllide A dehydrogenase
VTSPAPWLSSDPAAEGLNRESIDDLLGWMRNAGMRLHAVILLRNDRLVTEEYFPPWQRDSRRNMYSCAKRVLSTLCGIAQRRGDSPRWAAAPDRVAILGAGPIGIAIAAAARRAGARETFITAKHEMQARIAASLGIDHIIDPSRTAVAETVMKHTDGLGADCVIEGIGYKSKTIELALQLVRKGGRILFTGVFEEPVTLNFGDLLIKEASIRASHAFGLWNLVPEYQLAAEMLARGQFPAGQIITHRLPLERIGEAFEQKLKDPANTMKVEIVFPG